MSAVRHRLPCDDGTKGILYFQRTLREKRPRRVVCVGIIGFPLYTLVVKLTARQACECYHEPAMVWRVAEAERPWCALPLQPHRGDW